MFQIMSTKRRANTTPRRQSHARGGPLPNQENVHDRPIAPTRRPLERPVMRQNWRDLLFVHWPVPPESLRPLIPEPLELDLFEGTAYVGLIPFTMTGVRPIGLPAVAGLSSFHETNVRTYVHVNGRDPGVWFFNLEAANSIAVRLARRLFHLPYHYARMFLEHEAGTAPTSRRRSSTPVRGAGLAPTRFLLCPGNSGWARPACDAGHPCSLPGRTLHPLYIPKRSAASRPSSPHALSLTIGKDSLVGRDTLGRRGNRAAHDHPPGTLLHRCQRRGIPASRGLISATPNVFAYPQFLIRHAWALHRAFCSCTRRVIGALDHI